MSARKIENPDHLGPYWAEIGYYPTDSRGVIFKRRVSSGPAPIVVCAERFHANRRLNIRRLLEAKAAQ